MKKEKPIIPENILHQLRVYEAPFEQANWDSMSKLLTQNEKKRFLFLPYNCYLKLQNTFQLIKNKLKTILMITLTLSTILTLCLTNNMHRETNSNQLSLANEIEVKQVHSKTNFSFIEIPRSLENKHISSSNLQEKNNALSHSNKIDSPFNNPVEKTNHTETNKNGIIIEENEDDKKELDEQIQEITKANNGHTIEIVENTNHFIEEVLVKNDTSITNSNKVYKKVYRQEWVPAVYETTNYGVSEVVDDFWIGIHYSTQGMFLSETFDHGGFNIQLMSGNIFKNQNRIGIYGGFDFGALFNGRSANENIVLNTLNRDIGITRISNRTYDFLGRIHIEFPGRKAVPYFTGFAGPRVHATGQYIKALLPYRDQESSSYSNIHASTSFTYGLGLGIRFKLNNRISFDTRYEYITSTRNATIYDLQNVVYDESRGTYEKNLTRINSDFGMLKIGFIFNLSTAKTTKELIHEGYYMETFYDSLDIDPADKNRVFLPCPTYKPCDCETKVDEAIREYRRNNPCNDDYQRNDNNSGSIRIPKRPAPRIHVPRTPVPKT